MKLISIINLALFLSSFVYGQNTKIEANDFNKITGQWEGTLTYLDYGDDSTSVTLQCNMAASWKGEKGTFSIGFMEPNGTIIYDKVKLKRLKKGRMVKFDKVKYQVNHFERDKKSSNWALILFCYGRDNNRNAEMKLLINFEDTTLTFTKEVKYENTQHFFVRNKYVFKRQQNYEPQIGSKG